MIEKSNQLFIESERKKAEVKQKKIEQGEKTKQKLDSIVLDVQHGVNDITDKVQKSVEGIKPKFPKKRIQRNC